MIPPPRAMASMLPVDPIVNDIQHETPRPHTQRLRTHASASLLRFPACHESVAAFSPRRSYPIQPMPPRPGEPELGIGGASGLLSRHRRCRVHYMMIWIQQAEFGFWHMFELDGHGPKSLPPPGG